MSSKYLIDAETTEKMQFFLEKDIVEERKELERRAAQLGFKIPYEDEVGKLVARINKTVKKDIEEMERKKNMQESSAGGDDTPINDPADSAQEN